MSKLRANHCSENGLCRIHARKRSPWSPADGRGIGLGIAKALAAEGCDLAICGVQDEKAAEPVVAAIRQTGAEVLYCRADVAVAAGPRRLLRQIADRFGRLDVLVNNAGVAPDVRADILEATEESFERLIRINLQGPYFLTQAAARWMIEQGRGRADFRGCIVNVSSISATVASPNRGEYCITKAGVSMATQLWAVRLGEFDIPVYEVRPGIIKTDMTAAGDRQVRQADRRRALRPAAVGHAGGRGPGRGHAGPRRPAVFDRSGRHGRRRADAAASLTAGRTVPIIPNFRPRLCRCFMDVADGLAANPGRRRLSGGASRPRAPAMDRGGVPAADRLRWLLP